jgi:predicted TIM-barrel fold metal-dependent hydrolase
MNAERAIDCHVHALAVTQNPRGDDQLVDLAPMLDRAGVRVHVDHCGRPDPGAGLDEPGFRELLRWGRSGRAVV